MADPRKTKAPAPRKKPKPREPGLRDYLTSAANVALGVMPSSVAESGSRTGQDIRRYMRSTTPGEFGRTSLAVAKAIPGALYDEVTSNPLGFIASLLPGAEAFRATREGARLRAQGRPAEAFRVERDAVPAEIMNFAPLGVLGSGAKRAVTSGARAVTRRLSRAPEVASAVRPVAEEAAPLAARERTVPFVPADTGEGAVLPKLNLGEGTLMLNYLRDVEMVPVSWLGRMPGNELRHGEDRMREYAESIAEEGFNNPLMISVGRNSRFANLGEGNHRLEIARRLGYTHVPARVVVGNDYPYDALYERTDLVPEADRYFPANARPSDVFSTLQAGGDLSALPLRRRERIRTPEDDALDALLEEFRVAQAEENRKARGGLAVKRKKKGVR